MSDKVQIDREDFDILLAAFEAQTNGLRRRPGVKKSVEFRDEIIARARAAMNLSR
jgi:hypothetical protein